MVVPQASLANVDAPWPLEPLAHATLQPPRLGGGRYAITRRLGRGSQADVYLAWDELESTWRALKVAAPAAAADPHMRDRFALEGRVMAGLDHPHLLSVVDVDEDHGLPFIVMELARGGSVGGWLKRHGAMPAWLAAQVIVKACEGLAEAHANGIVHRDVKPHNLLLTEEGEVRVTDFGVAFVSQEATLTATGSVLGTLSYMAPEQRNDPHNVDPRADVYALGATLFKMTTLRVSADLFYAGISPELLDGVPELFRDIIVDACAYDPADRIQSVQALRDRIQEVMEYLHIEQDPPLAPNLLPLPLRPPEVLTLDSGVDPRRFLAPGEWSRHDDEVTLETLAETRQERAPASDWTRDLITVGVGVLIFVAVFCGTVALGLDLLDTSVNEALAFASEGSKET